MYKLGMIVSIWIIINIVIYGMFKDLGLYILNGALVIAIIAFIWYRLRK